MYSHENPVQAKERKSMRLWSLIFAVLFVAPAFAAGLDTGSNLPGYNPKHLSGPDKGTKECPS